MRTSGRKRSSTTIAFAPQSLQLVADLARRVERVERDGDRAGAGGAEQRDDELRAVRQADRHPVPRADAEPLERRGEALDEKPSRLNVIEEVKSRPAAGTAKIKSLALRVPPRDIVEQLVQTPRRVLDARADPRAVVGQPRVRWGRTARSRS